MKKYFGTDGIRGKVNQGLINGEKFFKFGLAAATYFANPKKNKPVAIIAKDTRLSGYTLEPALVSGLTSAGMNVYTFGPMPTNALAMITKRMKANMGIMITASHNPYDDNGMKLFGPDGMKLSDKIESCYFETDQRTRFFYRIGLRFRGSTLCLQPSERTQ